MELISPMNTLDGSGRRGREKTFPTETPNRSHRLCKQKHRTNPLQRGTEDFLTSHISSSFLIEYNISLSNLLSSLPKRYTLYPPLLLLPQNTFTSEWEKLVSCLNQEQLNTLYTCIATSFSTQGVTHIALNAPVTLTKGASGAENRMRSPTGVAPLYGDFGRLQAASDAEKAENPTDADLQAAFWVRAVQNSGVVQIWAPLYSMFSRGNITEKARILGAASTFEGLTEAELGEKLEDVAVVDMYAGIGYFVFSYLKRGIGRVWAWELNGWSIEGLKRGCRANGWGVKSVRVDSIGNVNVLQELAEGLSDEHRVVAFHGDNRFAVETLSQLRETLVRRGAWKRIRHVNLGLLPTSRASWGAAAQLLDRQTPGWIHVHENVDIASIHEKRDYIVNEFHSLVRSSRKEELAATSRLKVECRNVERVKTYAPDVMHCVFDIRLPSATSMPIFEIENT
ncbi:S-adenosylmethionine-dependent methyltransferase [Emydomyces testavorans]|uniref:tRNA wybutosine-synthesizing protein 2 n=1 Tax=Emydomyces testavorans TaxID=2070801 RepID=A0AAF0DNG5_9EURO|nr:S-adenosylmethionine-dependent methyltransferase [Emydomyces testavorans]